MMKSTTSSQTPDLSDDPDVEVIYLGMKVRTLRGVWSVRPRAEGSDGTLRGPNP